MGMTLDEIIVMIALVVLAICAMAFIIGDGGDDDPFD